MAWLPRGARSRSRKGSSARGARPAPRFGRLSRVPGGLPPFYAHRFGRSYGPDSSRAALERALSAPVGGLETDCVLTADGEIALLHDPLLPHSTTLDGWARERALEEILAARLRDAGGAETDERPLALTWLLERLAGEELTLQLEVKAYADHELAQRTARRVCDVAGAAPEELRSRIEIISFWPDACALAAAAGFPSRVIVACVYTPDHLAGWAQRERVSGVILEAPYWSEPAVAPLRAAGLSLTCGAVNDARLLARVLPFGPDAVSTDRPHELAAETRELLAR